MLCDMHCRAGKKCNRSAKPRVFLPQSFSSVQSLSRVRLFATPWTAARQASLSITNSGSLLKLMSIKSVMPSSHVIILVILLCLLQTYLFNFYLVFWLLSFLLLKTSSRHSNFPSERSFALNNDLRPEHMGRYWNNLISPRRFYPSPVTSHFPSAPEIAVNSSWPYFFLFTLWRKDWAWKTQVWFILFCCQKDLFILYDPFHLL